MPNISEVWITEIYFKGTKGKAKERPVLVLNYQPTVHLYTIVEITSISPKQPPTFFDQFKYKIMDWQSCGLNRQSYIKCANTHRIDSNRLHYRIGIMNQQDFTNAVNEIANASGFK